MRGCSMKTKWYLCLCFVLLIGCSTETSHLTPTPGIQTTYLPSPAPTKLPVITPTPPAASPSPTPAWQPVIAENCLEVLPNTDHLSGKNYGKILFDRVPFRRPAYLYDLGTEQKVVIDNAYDFSVSPDGMMFAYLTIDDTSRSIVVSDNNAKILATTPAEYESLGHWPWTSWTKDGFVVRDYGEQKKVYINPFTGIKEILRDDFPNRYQPIDIGSGIFGDLYYDPFLTKVLYFAWDVSTDKYYISVWDILADKELVRFHPSGMLDSFPANWSSNGQEVIIYHGNSFEGALVSLHINGEIETLLPKGTGSPQFALSPDDKKLAFWLIDDKQDSWSLSVFDRETKIVTNYCIKFDSFPEISIWSPDSQKLLAYMYIENFHTETILVDIQQNFAIHIEETAAPAGWLK